MSLTHVRGPLGTDPAGWFSRPVPTPVTYIEPHPRRIQAFLDGRVVLDTEEALLVHRPASVLTYAFPRDVVGEALPCEDEPVADGYVRVPWGAADEWREEGRVLRHYPSNPYHRVDCRPARRHLLVRVGGEVLVDADETVVLFETGALPRLYVHPSHVRRDLLCQSGTSSYCNYKGEATWWSAVVGDTVVQDVAWSYEEPLPESSEVRGFLSFDAGRATVQAELPGARAAARARPRTLE